MCAISTPIEHVITPYIICTIIGAHALLRRVHPARTFDAARGAAYSPPMTRTSKSVCAGLGCLLGALVLATSTLAEPPPRGPNALPVPKAPTPAKKLPYHKSIKKLPETAQERRKVLSNLYALLATAPNEKTAQEIAGTIEALWYHSGSDTISLLLDRANTAASRKEFALASEILNSVVEIAPDFAEGWTRRAFVHYVQNDYARALGDLRRAVALEPNHYRALDGLGKVLRDVGQDRGALEAYRALNRVHPFWPGADEALKELEEKVDGQGI